jgi:hypothetical protein
LRLIQCVCAGADFWDAPSDTATYPLADDDVLSESFFSGMEQSDERGKGGEGKGGDKRDNRKTRQKRHAQTQKAAESIQNDASEAGLLAQADLNDVKTGRGGREAPREQSSEFELDDLEKYEWYDDSPAEWVEEGNGSRQHAQHTQPKQGRKPQKKPSDESDDVDFLRTDPGQVPQAMAADLEASGDDLDFHRRGRSRRGVGASQNVPDTEDSLTEAATSPGSPGGGKVVEAQNDLEGQKEPQKASGRRGMRKRNT